MFFRFLSSPAALIVVDDTWGAVLNEHNSPKAVLQLNSNLAGVIDREPNAITGGWGCFSIAGLEQIEIFNNSDKVFCSWAEAIVSVAAGFNLEK